MSDEGGIEVAKIGDGAKLTLLLGAAALAYIVKDHLTTPYDPLFDAVGAKHAIPPNFLRAIARHESGFKSGARNPKTGTYPNGSFDTGLMQINTKTGASFGYTPAQLLDPVTSIEAAAKVLAQNRTVLGAKFSSFTWAASYNVGPGRTDLAVGQVYAGAVMYHYQLYSFGRMFA